MGADALLLVSTTTVGQRFDNARNAIDAAARAGVSKIVYTSIVNASTAQMTLADEHRRTEDYLRDSGCAFVILRNGWYLENYTDQLPMISQYHALLGSAQDGLVSAASRGDYAAAAAAVLTQDGHLGVTYELGGTPFTLTELAATISDVLGTPIAYQDMSVADYTSALTAAGLPAEMAAAVADADAGLARGELFTASEDLVEAHRPARNHGARSHPERRRQHPPERREQRGVTVSTAGPSVDTHEMVLIHRVIRREFGQLPRLFRSAADDRARSKLIGAHAREMVHFLHSHHTGEDELLFPLLRERAVLDPELMDRMDAQHAQVNDAVAAISAELPAWTTSADIAAGERMAARIDATMPTLIDHLAEEEQKLLPIVSVTLTQNEWDALGKHGMSAIPLTRRLVILGHITEETDDAERQKFLQVVPAPARLAYKLIGHRQFTRETAAIRG